MTFAPTDPLTAAAVLEHLATRRRNLAARLEAAARRRDGRALRLARRLEASAERASVRAQILRERAALAA